MVSKCKCGVRCSFKLPGDTTVRWCKKCPDKPEEAICVAAKCPCGKRMVFGLPGNKAQWCGNCPTKPDNAVDVKNRKCECGASQPNFGIIGDKRPRWCAKCPNKSDDAINLTETKCECKKGRARFAKDRNSKPEWCSECPNKPDTSINIIDKKLCECGSARPSFRKHGSATRLWCKKCKPEDAIDTHKKCECGVSRASFALPEDNILKWCSRCPNKPEQALIITRKRCECGTFPSYGLEEDGIAKWCVSCPEKPDEAIDVVNPHCLTPGCYTITWVKEYRGYCLYCFSNLFPNENASRHYKTKEKLVVARTKEYLGDEYEDKTITYDRQISGGCSRKKPDIFIDMLTHCVFVEIDESGHNTKEYCACENKRMMLLMKDVGMRPVIFIRLNPDSYVDNKGKRHPSCFKHTEKTGTLKISAKIAWEKRLKLYLERLDFHLKNIPSQEVTIEHLYYDGFA